MKCFYYFKHKSRESVPNLHPILDSVSKNERVISIIPKLYEEKGHKLRIFKFSELRQATNNFNRLVKIGEGGFGCVYKGMINKCDDEGRKLGEPNLVVAIKKLNTKGFQGHKQWLAEVQFLGVVDHPNLVKLIGYCAVDGERGIQRLLVYEYMQNKSLENHLFRHTYPSLSWDQRMKIVIGAAQGLAYLHEELEIQVIYRDFKSSNVLLDADFKPKLSDFGLAREGPTAGHTHVSTAAVGTYGYAAPDYIETGHLTSKSDVWSFGVVLYEILTGRRSLERERPKSEQKLLDWVKQYPYDSRKFTTIIDPRLENKYSLCAARKVAKLANNCLVKSAKTRPKMSQVVEALERIIESSAVESPCNSYVKSDEDERTDGKKENSMDLPESAKRRVTHLAKLNEYFGGVNGTRFIVMQRGRGA